MMISLFSFFRCLESSAMYPYQSTWRPSTGRELIALVPQTDFNRDLHRLIGFGLENLDMNYKLEIHWEEDLNKYVTYLILRTSKGKCNDKESPTLIVFDSWGVLPTSLASQVNQDRSRNILFTKLFDQLFVLGSTAGFCTLTGVQGCALKSELDGNKLTLQVMQSTEIGTFEIWKETFKVFTGLLPLKGLRSAGDRTFCIEQE